MLCVGGFFVDNCGGCVLTRLCKALQLKAL